MTVWVQRALISSRCWAHGSPGSATLMGDEAVKRGETCWVPEVQVLTVAIPVVSLRVSH